jgi:hypothetical protein
VEAVGDKLTPGSVLLHEYRKKATDRVMLLRAE